MKKALQNRLKAYWRINWPGLTIVFTTWLVFFSRIISGRFVYFLDDLKIIYFPLEVAYAQFQAAGQLPLWSQYFGFGQPLLAWGQLGFFTPLHVVLRALQVPALDLLQISVVFYFALGLTGAYLFFRSYKFRSLISGFGAIVFIFSGFNIGHLNHVNFYTGTMLLPWLLLTIHYFIKKPVAWKAGILALLVGAMAMSAQPQVVLYTVSIAAVYGLVAAAIEWWQTRSSAWLVRIIGWTLLAAIAGWLLSSLAVLPLAEFLPSTERDGDLPVEQLLEFSYPPSHAITLISPYFFGDHESYWGAKGFQELAAFVGLIPLALASLALFSWRKRLVLRTTGAMLLMIGVVMAMGRYSPLYYYLVHEHILTSLNIPGRFVFFATVGLAFLAAVGLVDLINSQSRNWQQSLVLVLKMLALPAVLLSAFAIKLTQTLQWQQRLVSLIASADMLTWLTALSLVALVLATLAVGKKHRLHALVGLAVLVSLISSWNYNPVTLRSRAAESPFAQTLRAGEYSRLYSRDTLITSISEQRHRSTATIAPEFSIYQDVPIKPGASTCFIIPLHAADKTGAINVSLLPDLTSDPLDHHTINGRDIEAQPEQQLCFDTKEATENSGLLALTSGKDSGIGAYYNAELEREVYFVRVKSPTADQLERSRKPGGLVYELPADSTTDPETFLLARHLQATADTSSARWIGALSIKGYRDFIEVFLANDQEPIDGDGRHAIERNRRWLDAAGVTHLAQRLLETNTDRMVEAGFPIVDEFTEDEATFRLYENPEAYAKTFLVADHVFKAAADDVRAAMLEPDFDPTELTYISGTIPPAIIESTGNGKPTGSSKIVKYEPTEVVVEVETDRDAWLILNDSVVPEWQTHVDGELVPTFTANSVFRTAQVPAGQHTVTWSYHSPAVEKAVRLTLIGLALALLMLIPWHKILHKKKPPISD